MLVLYQNWQWDGFVNVPRPRTREAASLSIRAGDDSTISYMVPMVADSQGYHPLLEVHLDCVTVSSSLNDIRVLTTESCRVSGSKQQHTKVRADNLLGFGRAALPTEMERQPPVDIQYITPPPYLLPSTRSHQHVH